MRNEQQKQKPLVAFKGNDDEYYYIGELEPGVVKRAQKSLKTIKKLADNCEDYLYIDNSLLENEKLLEECQAAVFYYNDVFCVNKFTHEQSQRLKQMMQNQEKQGKTIIVKKYKDNKVKKIKRIDNNNLKIQTVDISQLNNEQRNALEFGKNRFILNGKKLTKSMVGDIIELAMDNKEKQQKEELCKTKTEGIKKQTDSPDRKSEFCTTKDSILRDMEKKLKNARDNLHTMMSNVLGKKKTNNYKPKNEDDDLWYMHEMALKGKKLFNPRNCCFKAGGELIKKLNREFDVLLRLAFKTMCMTYDEEKCNDRIETLEKCKDAFNFTYGRLKKSSDLRALDGGFLNCIKNIKYEWKDVINDYSAQENQTKEGKIIS